MLTCRSCGQESPDGFAFCGACGEPFTPVAAVREVRKVVTVVFCDVSGSTALGERLDPEAMRRTMRRYFEEIRLIVERHGGIARTYAWHARTLALIGKPAEAREAAATALAIYETKGDIPASAWARELLDSLSTRSRVTLG